MITATQADELKTLKAQAAELASTSYTIETNSGTYGNAECLLRTGCGDSRYGDYEIVETVGGDRKVIGCDPARAPGRARRNPNAASGLKEDRAKLKAIHDRIGELTKEDRKIR